MIVLLSSTRPNHIKASILYEQIKKENKYNLVTLSTGQHYTKSLDIHESVDLPIDINLNLGTSNKEVLTEAIQKELKKLNPKWLIVIGDVNSTFAGALAAKRLGIKIIHIESGMRSGDWKMEEEFNRVFVDSVSNILFCNDLESYQNLENEFNLKNKKVFVMGSTNTDMILRHKDKICVSNGSSPYGIVTLHRRELLNNLKELKSAVDVIENMKQIMPLKVYAHPNLVNKLKEANISLNTLSPLGYVDFMKSLYNSNFILTDSGGLQQESIFLSIPCVTYRDSTEHTLTLFHGNMLTKDKTKIMDKIKSCTKKTGKINPALHKTTWGDGKVAQRMMEALHAVLHL